MAAHQQMDLPSSSSSSSSGPPIDLEVKEELYSLELARRAVARAALHLGVESMTERTLDVLADVLLTYLSRTGSAMSHLVESSGRTSAHANVLDALQACQLVSAPAVQRVYISATSSTSVAAEGTGVASTLATAGSGVENGDSKMGESTGGTSDSVDQAVAIASGAMGNTDSAATPNQSVTAAASSADWKGLASFLFGPNWFEESDNSYGKTKASEDGIDKQNEKGQQQAGGGKAAHVSSTDDAMDVDDENKAPTSGAEGKSVSKTDDVDREDKGTGGAGGGGSNGRGVGGKSLARDSTGGPVFRFNQGWNAPFFDEVSDFPRASETCANPHALPLKIGLSLHRKVEVDMDEADNELEEVENVLEHIPDAVFESYDKTIQVSNDVDGPTAWGSLKRKKGDVSFDALDSDMTDADSSRPQKRIKISYQKDGQAKILSDQQKTTVEGGGKTDTTGGNGSMVDSLLGPVAKTEEDFAYVPSFYPPPPSTNRAMDRGRTVVDMTEAERHQRQKMLLKSASAVAVKSSSMVDRTEEEAVDVRSSLVQLDRNHYWGSGWDGSARSSGLEDMAVPIGRPGSLSRAGADDTAPPAGSTAPGQARAADLPINPVNRASLSTVSRILEGSVDAAAM